LASGAELDFGDLGFLHNAYPLSSLPPGEGELRLWLPEVWQAHPACRVVELELFQTEMQILQAKRERIPRLTGAIGLGDIDTWVGGDFVEAAATAELGIRLPIFDAGTITRGIQKAALRRELARREVGILAGRLSRQVQSSLLSLRNSLEETANRQSECAELSKLSETAKLSANLGHGDPLLPFTLQVYKLEAELSIAEAKTRVAKSSRAYRVGLGQEPIPGLSNRILQTLVCDLEKPTAAAK
jgi:outer membrane protein TolC